MGQPAHKDKLNEQIKEDIKHHHDETTEANLKTDQASTTDTLADKATTTTKSEPHNPEEHTAKEKILNEEKPKGPTLRVKLAQSNPTLSKVVEYCIDSLDETFPSDRYHKKCEKARQEAKMKSQTLREELLKEYTEEELIKVRFDVN